VDQFVGEIPVIDLAGSNSARAEAIDHALSEVGFMLVAGHGVDGAQVADARERAFAFFHADAETKERVRMLPGTNRGWTGMAEENTSATDGVRTTPDLHETFTWGPFGRPVDPYHEQWVSRFRPNLWPVDLGLTSTLERLYRELEVVAQSLLWSFEESLGVDAGFLSDASDRHTSTMSANWYPALESIGEYVDPTEEQFRIGPHTDFGLFTILDRQPSAAGLQVQLKDGRWVMAPYLENTFLVNTGDLMNHWTAGRWRSTRHRVLPPSPADPDEELLSLVYFYAPAADVAIQPMGQADAPSILASKYIDDKLEEMRARV
jgi:isopenicillin N synthase-like dioxygenase